MFNSAMLHSYGVLKERFAKTRSLHPPDAEHKGFWDFPTSILQRKMVFVYTKTLLATAMNAF